MNNATPITHSVGHQARQRFDFSPAFEDKVSPVSNGSSSFATLGWEPRRDRLPLAAETRLVRRQRRARRLSENHGLSRARSARVLSNGRSLRRWREHGVTEAASIAAISPLFQRRITPKMASHPWPTSHGRGSSSATRMTFSTSLPPLAPPSLRVAHDRRATTDPADKFIDPVPRRCDWSPRG